MPRNLSLNISVGAELDKTLGATFKAATQSTNKLGKEHKKLQQAFKSANALKRYKSQLDDLEQQQKQTGKTSKGLQNRIEKTRDKYTAAAIAAKKYGIEIGSLVRKEKQLSRELSKQRRAMAIRSMGKRAGSAGMRATGGAFMSGSRLAAGGLMGLALGMPMYALSRATDLEEQRKMSGSVGLSLRDSMALGESVKGSELDYSHINDLLEEQQNKFGERAATGEANKTVVENLKGLGLNYDTVEGMNQLERFMVIMDRAAGLKNFDKAKSAVDAIFGGEGNKYLGLIKDQGIVLKNYIASQKENAHFTQAAEQDLISFNQSLIAFKATLMQGSDNILVQALGAITPSIEQWKKSLDAFFSDNKKVDKLVDDLSVAFDSLGQFAAWAVQNMPTILSGMTTVLGWLAWFGDSPQDKQKKEQSITQLQNKKVVFVDQLPEPASPGASAMRAKTARSQADLEQTGGQTITSKQDYQRLISQDNSTTNNTITVNQQPGESGEDLAKKIVDTVNRQSAVSKGI